MGGEGRGTIRSIGKYFHGWQCIRMEYQERFSCINTHATQEEWRGKSNIIVL